MKNTEFKYEDYSDKLLPFVAIDMPNASVDVLKEESIYCLLNNLILTDDKVKGTPIVLYRSIDNNYPMGLCDKIFNIWDNVTILGFNPNYIEQLRQNNKTIEFYVAEDATLTLGNFSTLPRDIITKVGLGRMIVSDHDDSGSEYSYQLPEDVTLQTVTDIINKVVAAINNETNLLDINIIEDYNLLSTLRDVRNNLELEKIINIIYPGLSKTIDDNYFLLSGVTKKGNIEMLAPYIQKIIGSYLDFTPENGVDFIIEEIENINDVHIKDI